MPDQIISFTPAQFVPSISFTGAEPSYIIRGANLFVKKKAEGSMYAVAYKGSKDIGETIPSKALTGTIAYTNVAGSEYLITGTTTAFRSELRIGSFVVTHESPSHFFVVEEVISDTLARVSRPFTTIASGVSADILPILDVIGTKRVSMIRGKVMKFPRGHYIGVGDGTFRVNGQPLSNTFALTKQPSWAMWDEVGQVYNQVQFGLTLPSASPLITLTNITGGVKQMQIGKYGIRVVAKSDENSGSQTGATKGGTGGYTNPSDNYTVSTTAIGDKIHIVFNAAMSVTTGQNAWDIYVSRYVEQNGALNAVNSVMGPWYLYETVTAAQLATENSVGDGTVSGLFHNIEFADGELEALNTPLTFDNFAAYDAEFLDIVATTSGPTPIFFSCLGQRTVGVPKGTSPGPTVVIGKPDNPEAILANEAVGTFNGDTIVGVVNVRGRWWLLCEASLQTAILTGIDAAPVTIRSFWDVGFRNPFNIKFLKDYVFGYSTQGFLRSIGVGDTSSVDFNFSSPVDDYTTNWICSHEITDYDPKNKAVLFFFSGYNLVSGYWQTMVLPYIPDQGIWNMPIILKLANSDFIVSGTAVVGGALYFLAGGRTSGGATVVKTYEFDAADGIAKDCYCAWAFTSMGSDDIPLSVTGVQELIGNVTNATVEVHGLAKEGTFDLAALDAGNAIPNQTFTLGNKTPIGRIPEMLQQVEEFSQFTVRLDFQSTDGSGRFDKLNMLASPTGSRT